MNGPPCVVRVIRVAGVRSSVAQWFTTEALRTQRFHLAIELTTSWALPSKSTVGLGQAF
jgi:hypothetical protein